jgi:hypothetical protein
MPVIFTLYVRCETLESRNAEVQRIEHALQAAALEIGRGRGSVTSGDAGGAGDWDYRPQARS